MQCPENPGVPTPEKRSAHPREARRGECILQRSPQRDLPTGLGEPAEVPPSVPGVPNLREFRGERFICNDPSENVVDGSTSAVMLNILCFFGSLDWGAVWALSEWCMRDLSLTWL